MFAMLVLGGAATLQLTAATIEIDVASGNARAEYVLVTDSASVTLVAMGATGDLVPVLPGNGWRRERGLYRVTAATVPGDTTTLRLEYRFPVGADRVPVFVPSVPADPAERRLTIRILGAAATVGLGDAFPRLTREPNGSLEARPANLPSFVLIPGARGGLDVNRLADVVVVLLLVGAIAAWWVRRR